MSTDSHTPICGIDLGTTNSCVALIRGGNAPEVISIDGNKTLPSVLACKDGQWLVGEAAKNHGWVAPTQAVSSIKRKMDDTNHTVTLGDQTLTPIEVSAKILTRLIEAASAVAGCKTRNAVITVPAWFGEAQRQATLAAGKLAGLDAIQIINEPTAAAIAHQNIPVKEGQEERWLVYDLGGGTFDVSVLNVTGAAYEVLASQGNTHLGGDDFDHRLAEHFDVFLRDRYNVNPSDDPIAQARLQMLAEKTKIRLSNETSVQLNEPIIINGEIYALDLTITRVEFEAQIQDLIKSTIEKTKQTLTEANVQTNQLDRLLLVGGSTRIPLVADQLTKATGLQPESWLDPDLSVAIGASIRGAISNGALFQRSVVDICPHTLGVAAVGEEDFEAFALSDDKDDVNENRPRTFAPLIRRNSRLPAKFVRTFYKSHAQQASATIWVYQGESTKTRENTFIGEFDVHFKNQQNRRLDISFEYDLNGTVNICVNESGEGETRRYSMDLSRSPQDNREGSQGALVEKSTPANDAEHDTSQLTNYLISKVKARLEKDDHNEHDEIRELLQQYQHLLAEEDPETEETLDQIEDRLYEWIEEVEPA